MARSIVKTNQELETVLRDMHCLHKGHIMFAVDKETSFLMDAASLNWQDGDPVRTFKQPRKTPYALTMHKAFFAPLAWLQLSNVAKRVFKRNPAKMKMIEVSNELIAAVYGVTFQWWIEKPEKIKYEDGYIVIPHEMGFDHSTVSWLEKKPAHCVGITDVQVWWNCAYHVAVVGWKKTYVADDDTKITVQDGEKKEFKTVRYGRKFKFEQLIIYTDPLASQTTADGGEYEYRLTEAGILRRHIAQVQITYTPGNGGHSIVESTHGWHWDDGGITSTHVTYGESVVLQPSEVSDDLRKENARLDLACQAMTEYGSVAAMRDAYDTWQAEKTIFENAQMTLAMAEAEKFAATLK